MSKKKQTPAEVASQIAKFLAKQEETLSRYPVGPLANAARMNMKKGYAALEALKGQNESMRTQMPAQGQAQMKLGGDTLDAALSQLTPAQVSMYNSFIEATGASPEAALAVVSVSDKESSGDHTKTETDYSRTSNERIREIFSRTADMSDEELNTLKADPEAFFNKVYDNRNGNGKGEGYKYRGRGMIQLTGKSNYRKASRAIFGDTRLVDNPDLILENPEIAGQVATWFMTKGKGVGAVAGIDLTSTDLTPEQIGTIADSSYAVVAGTNDLAKAQKRRLFAEGTARQHEFLGRLNVESVPTSPARAELQSNNSASGSSTQEPRTASEQEMLARAMGWTPETNIEPGKFTEMYQEAEKANPGKALTFFPDSSTDNGGFFGTAGSVGIAPAEVVTELPRDAEGRPIFSGMRQKNNYYANYHLGEQGVRQMEDMRGGIHEATGQFAKNYLLPTTLGALGVASLPTLASGAAGLSSLGSGFMAGEFGTALSTVGSQFLRGQALRTTASGGLGINVPGLLGAGTTAAGVSSGLSRLTGDYGLTNRNNAYQVAMDPNMSNTDKAAYFATLGIELSPITFNSPTAIRNIFRGRPSDFPGTYAGYLNARRSLINTADEGAAATRATEDAFQASRAARTSTKTKAADLEAKAAAAETKAAKAQAKANEVQGGPADQASAKVVAKAEKAGEKAAKARAKADRAKAADEAALTEQQAANARRLNARGRAGVADDELAAFNKQYNAAREPYSLGPSLANTNDLIPSSVAGMATALYGSPQMTTENVDPATVDPRQVQVGFGAPDPITARTIGSNPLPDQNLITGPGTGGADGGSSVEDVVDLGDGEKGADTPSGGQIPNSDVAMTPDTYSLEMGKGNLMMGIPTAAALGSAAIQNRALNQMQAPVRPLTTDIGAFNYESNIAQQLQDVRDSTQAMGRADGMSETARAAMRGSLLGERFRQEQRLQAADQDRMQAARRSYDAMATQVRQANNALRNKYLEDRRVFNNDMAQARADIRQAPLDASANFAQDYLKNIYYPQQQLAIEQVGRMGQYGLPQGLAEEQNQD